MVEEEVVILSKEDDSDKTTMGEDTSPGTGISLLIRGDTETINPVTTPTLTIKEARAIREDGEIKIGVTTSRVTTEVKGMDKDLKDRGLKATSTTDSVVETGIRDNNSSMMA